MKTFLLSISWLLFSTISLAQTGGLIMNTSSDTDSRGQVKTITLSVSDMAGEIFTEECGFSFSWSTGDGTAEITVPLTEDAIEYTVTIFFEDQFFGELTISSDCFLNLAVMPNVTPCPGGEATLMVTNPYGIPLQSGVGYTFYWSDQGGNPGPPVRTVNPWSTTDYTVTVTHVSNCATSMTGTVVVGTGTLINFTEIPEAVCQGDAVELKLTYPNGQPLPNGGGWLYQWSTGHTTSSFVDFPTSDKTYTVTVTDPNGCTQVMPFQHVSVYPIPNVSIMKYDLVSGRALLDAGFSPGTSYEWNTGEEGQTTIAHVPGTYTVTATNQFGCEKVASLQVFGFQECSPETIYIEIPPIYIYVDTCLNGGCAITAEIIPQGPTTICKGDELVLSTNTNATGPVLYNWNTGKVTKNITVTEAGDYTVTVTDQNGCTAVASVWIDQKSIPFVSDPADFTICKGDNAIVGLYIIVGNLDEVEDIDWFPAGGQSTQQGQAYSYHLYNNGVFPFSVTVRFKNGCSVTREILVTVETCTPVQDPEGGEDEFLVFPNPTSNVCNISSKEDHTLYVYDYVGRFVQKFSAVSGTYQFNVEGFPAGEYFLHLVGDEREYTERLVVVR